MSYADATRRKEYKREWAKKNRTRHESARLKYRYGITLHEFENMVLAQKGLCSVCNLHRPLCVDHDHQTGEIRGLLCRGCNSAMGQFWDNPEILIAAANYLKGCD